jgi:hypothetical protein
MDLTYLPALIVMVAAIVPCVFLFRKWLKEDSEKKKNKDRDSK